MGWRWYAKTAYLGSIIRKSVGSWTNASYLNLLEKVVSLEEISLMGEGKLEKE